MAKFRKEQAFWPLLNATTAAEIIDLRDTFDAYAESCLLTPGGHDTAVGATCAISAANATSRGRKKKTVPKPVKTRGAASWQTTPRATEGTCISGSGPVPLGSRTLPWAGARVSRCQCHSTQSVLPLAAPSPAPARGHYEPAAEAAGKHDHEYWPSRTELNELSLGASAR